MSEETQKENARTQQIQPQKSQEEETRPIFDLRQLWASRRQQPIPLTEAIILMDYLDRREERQWRRETMMNQPKEPPIKIDDLVRSISDAVKGAIKEALPTQPTTPPKTEESEKVTELMNRLQSLQEELKSLKEKTLEERIIEKVTGEIKEVQEQIAEIVKRVEANPPPPKGELDTYLEVEERLKKLGIKKEPKEGMVVLGEEGIPIKGEIPAWVAFGPYVADKIMSTVEKRLDRIASKIGLASPTPEEAPQAESKELIKLPPKPEIPKETLAPQTPEEAKPPTPELTQEPKEELIKIPEKPGEVQKSPEKSAEKTEEEKPKPKKKATKKKSKKKEEKIERKEESKDNPN